MNSTLESWVDDLEARHLKELTFPEFRRSVQALSDVYVHRKKAVTNAALKGRGKRAAFAAYYAPLHMMLFDRIVEGLSPDSRTVKTIVDAGCGTGVGGIAWARRLNGSAQLTGVDIEAWPLQEARITADFFGVNAQFKRGDMTKAPQMAPGLGLFFGFALNELDDTGRDRCLKWVIKHLKNDARLIIVEPISKSISPWWADWVTALAPLGAVSREWKFSMALPPFLRKVDKAARLNHGQMKARTLSVS